MAFNPNYLVGKTIERVTMNKFNNGRGGKANSPVIHFTDGTMIYFNADETDVGVYGIDITYVPRQKR